MIGSVELDKEDDIWTKKFVPYRAESGQHMDDAELIISALTITAVALHRNVSIASSKSVAFVFGHI